MPAAEGVHSNVKAIQDMEAACARFARAVVELLPEVERELRQTTEALEERQTNLRREIDSLEDQISSADEDDDVSSERHRVAEAEDELASVGRRIRRLEETSVSYTKQARAMEHLATAHTIKAREFLTGAAEDLKAYLAQNYKQNLRHGEFSISQAHAPGAIDLIEEDDGFFIHASRRSDIDPDGFLDVVMHGTPHYVLFKDNELSSHELANMIKENPQFSGQPIRLLSCSTGESEFAQRLANELGVVVKAPNDILWASENGDLSIGLTPTVNTGSWVEFLPNKNNE